jgi:hypothetical protein
LAFLAADLGARPLPKEPSLHQGTSCSAKWVPPTPANPRSRGRLVQPCGCTPTGRVCLPRLCSRRRSAGRVSCRFVHGHPTFRGFSPLAAARPSRIAPSSMPFPTLRCRGSEDVSLRAEAFSDGDVVHAVSGSLLSWLFPPFEDDLPASSHTSAGLLSWASFMCARFDSPCGSPRPAHTCALQSVRDPEDLARHRALLRGVPVSAICPVKGQTLDSPWTRPTSPPKSPR